jgi:hypothetical protein
MRDAVIFDIDGTLCDVSSVRHHVLPAPGKKFKDFHKFHAGAISCPPHAHVVEAARAAHAAGLAVLVVTARSSEWMEQTVWWLLLNDIPFDQMYMRNKGDGRKDFFVKSGILAMIRADGFNPVHAWDDNPNVIALWTLENIPTTVVAGWAEED